MANNLSGISYTNNFNNLDGLSIVQADELYVDGTSLDPDNLVPYTGSTKTTDLGSQNIKTTRVPTANADLTNKLYVDGAVTTGGSGTLAIVNLNFVKYTGSISDTDLGTYKISSSAVPTTGINLTNKTYVDTQDALRLPYTGSISDTDLGTFKISSSAVPTTANHLTNKTYVDTQDALRVPYTGASANLQLGSNSLIATTAQFTAITSATPSLALGVDGSGNLNSFPVPTATNLIPLNNTWTGTNTFNNTLTTGVGYTSNLNSIIQTIQTPSGQSAGNFTTTGLPSGVPAGSVLSGSYVLTAGVSSGAMGMWLGAYAYTSSQNSFSFTGMSGSQTLALYVYQYNTAGTLAVQISDSVYTITTSSATVSGSFLANKFSAYTGKIVFYFQASAVNQSVSFSAFFHDIGSSNINGSLSITSVATETPITTIGLNSSNQLIKYTNPVSSVFSGSVSINYVPYGSAANVFANSIMYQSGTQLIAGGSIYASGDIGTGSNINATGNVNCSAVAPSAGYIPIDDRSLRPKDISAGTEQFFFASWNNDGGSPYADAIGMNGWTDSSGGKTNVLMVRKDTYGIRQYQGAFGSTTPFSSTYPPGYEYMDVCMKGVADGTMTEFTATGGTWNQTLWVGSGTDKGTAQVIVTDGNLHLDPKAGKDIYIGFYRVPPNIYNYASSSIINTTRYQSQFANIDADANAYFDNASAGGNAYFNLIISNNAGNTNHFLNSSNRSADGGQNCYTIRNDTFGGVRFMGTNGGFSAYDGIGSGGANYCNAIFNYTTGAGTGNVTTWNNYGFTLFCNTSKPSGNQAAYGIVSSGTTTNFVVSLSPGIAWMDLQVWAGIHYHYVYGSLVVYLAGGGNWVYVSDAREKEDINDLKTSRSLERIMKCKPKYYKRKYYDTDKDGKDTTPAPQSTKDTICIGLLAQDVLQHNPHCVSGWKNDNIKETDDDDGSRYGINYNDFTIHLIGAVQEQQKQIDDLKQQLDDYKRLTEERFNKLVNMITQK